MTIRATGALLCALGLLCASSTVMAEPRGEQRKVAKTKGGTGQQGSRRWVTSIDVRTQTERATTVKSSKSNTSDRMGGGGAKRTNGSVGDPHETTGDGRRRSEGTQGNTAPKPGLSMNFEKIELDYKTKKPKGQNRGDR